MPAVSDRACVILALFPNSSAISTRDRGRCPLRGFAGRRHDCWSRWLRWGHRA